MNVSLLSVAVRDSSLISAFDSFELSIVVARTLFDKSEI